MRLTSAHPPGSGNRLSRRWLSAAWSRIVVGGALLFVYELDRRTGSAPVQHLYYLPIILAALSLRRGGPITAMAAIVLYHLANPHLLTLRYEESDIVQMALFGVVGAVTARLRHDAERLHTLAMTDDLTGLHNLRSFEARLTGLLRASRDLGAPLSLLVLDVDRLKSLNDAHGHLTGAEAVRAVGHILARRLPSAAVASRYGGDEFVVALPALGESEAAEMADVIRGAVSMLAPVLAGKSFPAGTLSVSIGLACLDHGLDFSVGPTSLEATGEAFFRRADRALYRAKAAGRNQLSSDRASAE